MIPTDDVETDAKETKLEIICGVCDECDTIFSQRLPSVSARTTKSTCSCSGFSGFLYTYWYFLLECGAMVETPLSMSSLLA